MDTVTLLCIIGGGVLFLIVVAVVLIRRSNKKRFQKLQQNLNKYKAENQEFEHNAKITLAKDEEKKPEEKVEEKEEVKQEPLIEEYDEEPVPVPTQRRRRRDIDDDFASFLEGNSLQNKRPSTSKQSTTDDFEDFLEEHAYSRRILSKDIRSKLQDLPPEIKAVILSNVFNKYDDNI